MLYTNKIRLNKHVASHMKLYLTWHCRSHILYFKCLKLGSHCDPVSYAAACNTSISYQSHWCKTLQLYFWTGFLLMYLVRQLKMAQILVSLPLLWETSHSAATTGYGERGNWDLTPNKDQKPLLPVCAPRQNLHICAKCRLVSQWDNLFQYESLPAPKMNRA